ncbi:semaphorin-7A-like isoform X2 [Ctenopharyngodon idella]|uniref:semaphorin-7A-like isoform X2 n=1 Tax=Ctenopharyngodon idella TaxID=7959 RepID=UPI00223072E9|nr:semaphorin-7A-like isoform X2 [Ctenopharyngodon idella]
MGWTCFSVLLIWISCVCSTKVHYNARVTVKNEGITRYSFENHQSGLVKLVSTSGSKIIWVGGNESLYSIKPAQDSKPKLVDVNLCKDESKDSDNSECAYRLSLLSPGAKGNLFFCGSVHENTKCCYMNSDYSMTDCFRLENYEPNINEPSLLVDDMLYFTKSEIGLYRISKDKNYNIWSQAPQMEQKYLKLIAGKGKNEGKIYSFFAEKHKSEDQWIPRVSQSCMNDRGGRKGHLQNSWTSMIYARLFCGSGYEFSQLIDVATLETDNDIKIYALFRNYWNMSAVCVYNMTKISAIFNSSQFNSNKDHTKHRPGTCVNDSTTLSDDVLTFMKERPEMKDWVMPENGPLLFKHCHYTHIQVDRQQNNTVLLLSLESGRVHKVLEKSVFIIAEYLPFPHGTHITSMLLDASEKRLFVSSSNEVVQIDLKACHVYGDDCTECLLSRDPYCGWNSFHCTFTEKNQVANSHICSPALAAPSKTEIGAETSVVHVPPSSRHFLLCPMTSHHATYHWLHGNTHEECVRSDQGCLYLIESMNKTHEGSYICVSSEDIYQKTYKKTVAQYQLSMSRSDAHRVAPIVLPCLLLLLTVPYFLL